MKRIVLLGMGGALLGVSGCGPAAVQSFYTDDELFSRSMAMQTDGSGEANGVIDKSFGEQTMTITQRTVNGAVVDGAASVSGSMAGGTTVPGDDGLPVVAGSQVDRIASFRSADSFLGTVQEGANYATVVYRTQLGDRKFVTYGVTKAGRTSNMPGGGTATYNGKTNGTVYGSKTGESTLAGDVRLDATFLPGSGAINGRMQNLRLIQGADNFALGSDIVMNTAPIIGNSYQGGSLQFVTPGTNTANGTMAGSSYDGSFYGNGATETAGTFQFNALGIPVFGAPVPTTENMQGIGAFGGNR